MIAFFDLEGPLSPQDNAYELFSRIPNGKEIYERLSRYDDILTLEGREGYEPGDTLALIAPFLKLHGITERDVVEVSNRARIVTGARELLEILREDGWKIYIISTSYEQHALNIARRLGIEGNNVCCTKFRVPELSDEVRNVLREFESRILRMDEKTLIRELDELYFEKLPRMGCNVFELVKVCGGRRKTDAVKRIMEENDSDPSRIMVVGDSITDYDMLRFARDNGGLSIAFNGNEYSIPYASIAIASTDLRYIYLVASAFVEGKEKALDVARRWEKIGSSHFHISCVENMDGNMLNRLVELHKECRRAVRGEAGKLG